MNTPRAIDQASPVVATTFRDAAGGYTNLIVGGLSRRQEIASRICQGLMSFAFFSDGRAAPPEKIVGLSFKYADLILSQPDPVEESHHETPDAIL